MAKIFDIQPKPIYTEIIEQAVRAGVIAAMQQAMPALANLDNRIEDTDCYSLEDGVTIMPNEFREVYSYTDEHGEMQTIRFRGKNKRETDARFQEFLCKPKQIHEAPTLRTFVDSTYRKSFIDCLEATTRSNYERYLRLYILPFMGNMKMDEITLGTIQDFYDWLASGKSHGFQCDICEKSIDRIGGFLSRVLIVAESMKVIEESPFKIKLLRNNGRPSDHHKALPDSVVDRVKQSIPSIEDERQRLYMGFLAYTGLRREEILGLGWEHLNLAGRYGDVQRVIVFPNNKLPVVKEHPKTEKSSRTFIIPQPLMDLLITVKDKTGYVIHGRNQDNPVSFSTFQRTYRAAFKALGITEYDNHDWRATFGTQLKEAGMTSAQVADMMGHADTRMVETVYAPRRHEGVMKHKDTIEALNRSYSSAQFLPGKTAL